VPRPWQLLVGDATQPAWVAAGPDGATVWQITADAFARLRAGHRELERAFFRHVASRVRAAGVDDLDGAILQAPPLPARPPETRPVVRIFDNQSYQFAYFQEVNQSPEYQYQLDPVEARLCEATVDLARGAFVRLSRRRRRLGPAPRLMVSATRGASRRAGLRACRPSASLSATR